jgi:CheY-like chemotaxis protein
MGGDISVVYSYGVGSTFTVTLPQEIRNHEKLASVETPDKKRVLVYELRDIYAKSIVSTINNLGVEYTLVSSNSEFCDKAAEGLFSFAFIASDLYEGVREQCTRFNRNIKIAVLTEFGEAVVDQNLNILALPVHAISVANALNGITTSSTFSANTEVDVRFIAPDARVLIVDDINTNLKVAEGLLLPYKMQVELCGSGLRAIEAIKYKSYDIVFMDHMMPEMDGIEATVAIRAWEKEQSAFSQKKESYGKIPIIALTANAIAGVDRLFSENRLDDFLPKPLEIASLNICLRKWLPPTVMEELE